MLVIAAMAPGISRSAITDNENHISDLSGTDGRNYSWWFGVSGPIPFLSTTFIVPRLGTEYSQRAIDYSGELAFWGSEFQVGIRLGSMSIAISQPNRLSLGHINTIVRFLPFRRKSMHAGFGIAGGYAFGSLTDAGWNEIAFGDGPMIEASLAIIFAKKPNPNRTAIPQFLERMLDAIIIAEFGYAVISAPFQYTTNVDAKRNGIIEKKIGSPVFTSSGRHLAKLDTLFLRIGFRWTF